MSRQAPTRSSRPFQTSDPGHFKTLNGTKANWTISMTPSTLIFVGAPFGAPTEKILLLESLFFSFGSFPDLKEVEIGKKEEGGRLMGREVSREGRRVPLPLWERFVFLDLVHFKGEASPLSEPSH